MLTAKQIAESSPEVVATAMVGIVAALIEPIIADVQFLLVAHHAERSGRISGKQLTDEELEAIRKAVDVKQGKYRDGGWPEPVND